MELARLLRATLELHHQWKNLLLPLLDMETTLIK